MNRPLLLQKQTKLPHQSFLVRHARVPHLYDKWHYHRELELLYVIQGDGTRFVGDSIEPFFSGDMVLVGSDVPHFWQSGPGYFAGDENIFAEAILLQFTPDLLGDGFKLKEFESIRELIDAAKRGITFSPETKERAAVILWRLLEARGSRKMIELLELLDLFSLAPDARPLSQFGYQSLLNDHSSQRIQEVCDYLSRNYLRAVNLAEVASVANMSEKSFCRFFKRATQKTFVQFLTELRLSHSCKLLHSVQEPIASVCFASGFNNLSNFNRLFKRSMGVTPTQYRQSIKKDAS